MFKWLRKWELSKLAHLNKHCDLEKWPHYILLQIILLKRKFIRELCCYCGQNLTFKRSENIIGDSGEICPTCLRKECPELYEEIKTEDGFTPRQIRKAEKK